MLDANLQKSAGLFELEPEKIDCSQSWIFWASEPDMVLQQSLQNLGQLSPVLVRPAPQQYQLVSGYKRVLILSRLGCKAQALQVEGDEVQLGLIYLQANLGRRLETKDIVRAARYFQSRLEWAKLQDLLQAWIKPLAERRVWPLIMSWLELPLSYDQALYKAGLPLEMAPRLLRLDTEGLQLLKPLFCNLSWSANKARNLLDWLIQASRSADKNAGKLIQELQLPAILDQGLSPRDTQEKILARVKALRFPCLQNLEKEFASLCSELQGRFWRVSAEKNFETDALYLQGKVQDARDMTLALQELQEICAKQTWSRLKQWQKEQFYPE